MNRRCFLGSTLMLVPGVRVLASLAQLREARFFINYAGFEPITVDTFTNGKIAGWYGDRPLSLTEDRSWTRLHGDWKGTICSLRVKRAERGCLDVDWVCLRSGDCAMLDDYSGFLPDSPSLELTKEDLAPCPSFARIL